MLFEVKKKSLCSEMIGIRRVIQIIYIDCGGKISRNKKYHKKTCYWDKDYIINHSYV